MPVFDPAGVHTQEAGLEAELGPLLPVIDVILEEDRASPAKKRHTAKRIFERLRDEHGFAGGYTVVKDQPGAQPRDLRASGASFWARPGGLRRGDRGDRQKIASSAWICRSRMLNREGVSMRDDRSLTRRARVIFAEARHAHALEAMARGLGAGSFNEPRDYARDRAAILWDGSEAEAVRFLHMRGASMQPGGLAWLVGDRAIDHQAAPGIAEWSQATGTLID